MTFISMDEIHKTYDNGFKALKGLSLDIEKGSFTVILGPSGAGKSTLLRSINGFETPSSGQIRVFGKPVNKKNLRSVRACVAMVFQQFNLVDRLSVMTNVLTGRLSRRNPLLSLFHLFPEEDYVTARKALARVGLSDKAWSRADKLSGGQQQRVGIARALAQEPGVILADEPVASLDPVVSREILSLLRDISRELNITVVASLHQIEFAKEYADRVIGMNAGQVVFDDSVEKLTPAVIETIYYNPDLKGSEHNDNEMAFSYA